MALMNPLLGSNLVTGPAPFDPTLIGNSVWLDGSADYLSRTPSAGTTTRWIVSFWVQRNTVNTGLAQTIFSAGTSTGNLTWIRFDASDNLDFAVYQGSTTARKTSNAKYRDVGWYHICVSFDSGSGIPASNRIRLFVNGIEVTDLSANTDTPSGETTAFNGNVLHEIGRYSFNGGEDSNVYLTQFTMLENKSFQNGDLSISDLLDSFTFGTNGSQYVPKADADIAALATTAGGNSFCLDFADSADLGNDISSNANDFTPNSMSSANQSVNTPSKVYPIVNALTKIGSAASTLAEGNTKATVNDNGGIVINPTLPFSGLWYFEINVITNTAWYPGIGQQSALGYNSTGAWNNTTAETHTWVSDLSNNYFNNNGSLTTYPKADPITGRFAVAWDGDNRALYFGQISGSTITWTNSGDPTSGSSKTGAAPGNWPTTGTDPLYFIVLGGGTSVMEFDFDEDDWTGVTNRPADAKSLNSENLTASDYQGIDYFNAVLVTGDATNDRAITGMGFASDLLVYKKRSAALSWKVQDVIRGVNNVIYFDATNAEQVETGFDTINDADGFTINNASNANDSGATYVAYGWLMGGAGAANSDGTISSTVSASSTGAWSLITWTGTGANGTIGHGLSGAPELVIVKNTNDNRAWRVLETVVNGGTHYLTLNTDAASAAGSTFWNNSNPTASVINLGSDTDTNDSGDTMLAISFRSVPGVCKVGSYIGNGNAADGPYVSVGFSPKWVMVKPVNAANPWTITDTSRDPINATTRRLHPNLSQAEAADSLTCGDILADGFKLRASHGNVNQSGITYLYLAMADLAGNGTLAPVYGR